MKKHVVDRGTLIVRPQTKYLEGKSFALCEPDLREFIAGGHKKVEFVGAGTFDIQEVLDYVAKQKLRPGTSGHVHPWWPVIASNIRAPAPVAAKSTPAIPKSPSSGMSMPPLSPRSDWRPPVISELPNWGDAKRIGYDLETRDPNLKRLGPGVRRGSEIVGFAVRIENGPGFYLPIGHEGGDNCPKEHALAYMRDQAANFKGEIVGANLPYDIDFSEEAGIKLRPSRHRDVQVTEALLDENQDSYSLDSILGRYKMPGKDETALRAAASSFGVEPKKELWRLPARFVATYGLRDVDGALDLNAIQERMISEHALQRIWDIECRLLPVLVKMRRRGVRVSFERLDKIEQWALAKESQALHEIHRLTGIQLVLADTTRSEALEPVLTHLGVKAPRTPSTNKPSIKKEFLQAIKHPVADLLLVAKKYRKLRDTFVGSIRTHAVGDRIHCTFKQIVTEDDSDEAEDLEGARYGRLSCKQPNLQQQPARDPEIGPRWRSIYLPDDEGDWACLDFSQQEPRWLVHYAEELELEGAKAAGDKYRNDPNTDNHQMMADICGIPRKPAKEIFLGKCYGMGGAKLCRKLGLPTEWRVKWKGMWHLEGTKEANEGIANGEVSRELAGPEGKAIIDKFNEGVPFVSLLEAAATRKAKTKGYIITAGGRRCRFPGEKGDYQWTHKALNRLIQGSSGDQTKKAMVDADDADIRLQLQVHDELDLTIWHRREVEQLSEIMMTALPCRVPHKVDPKIGPSWGEVA